MKFNCQKEKLFQSIKPNYAKQVQTPSKPLPVLGSNFHSQFGAKHLFILCQNHGICGLLLLQLL
jgi:hypothetical protein